MPRKPETIKGHAISAPRITFAGWWWVLRRVVLPILLFLAALDVVLYLLFTHVFGMCYGLMCL